MITTTLYNLGILIDGSIFRRSIFLKLEIMRYRQNVYLHRKEQRDAVVFCGLFLYHHVIEVDQPDRKLSCLVHLPAMHLLFWFLKVTFEMKA